MALWSSEHLGVGRGQLQEGSPFRCHPLPRTPPHGGVNELSWPIPITVLSIFAVNQDGCPDST